MIDFDPITTEVIVDEAEWVDAFEDFEQYQNDYDELERDHDELYDPDYDGQPDELTEWMDFDPDC